ncbi:HDOD domain-containing protein [Nibricoccus aquaticus]|uniref:HDOD domain-containing protein n=1 Tax=Nibricoccus aquaticus TaxID=2576891 RepID=UPI001586D8F3|nr:HDOD domain-containing protein [Nibricoccus aquaticus]
MVHTLAKQTITRVAAGLETGEAAGLAEIVELIQQLSGNANETSVEELAALIGKDIVVTAKVITAANTMGYNPSGVEIATISQAIHVIGFNKIRQLALALLLIENAERTLNPHEKREIAALALCSGLMAEAVMNRHGTHEPEQAFICASLRNYGRLLMTTFMLDEYRQAREISLEGKSEDEAFRGVFGLTPLELGHHLLETANLPESILKTLRSLPVDAIRQAATSNEIELLVLADLSVKLGELALKPDLSDADFQRGVLSLSARTGRVFGLDADALVSILGEASHQLNEFARTFNLTAISQQVNPRLQSRIAGEDPIAVRTAQSAARSLAAANSKPPVAPATSLSPSEAASTSPIAPTDTPPPVASTSETVFQQAFESGIEQLASLLDESPVSMSKVYQVVLKSALQGFAARDGLILTRKPDAFYVNALGSGPLFDAIRGRSLVRETDRDVFGIALQRMEDVFIYDATDPKIVAHIPAWMKPGNLASFVLLPIHENKKPFALLLAGWSEKKTKSFSVTQIRQVRSMLKLVGTARRLTQN